MNKEILKHIIRYILMIFIIILCVIIFNFSSEDGEKSNESSSKVIKSIILIDKNNRDLSQAELDIKIESMQIFVRKSAHFISYMLLGILTMSCAATFKGKKIIKFSLSIFFTFLYSCTDELHQRFIAGRSGSIKDVCLDTVGAFVGILLVLLIILLVEKIKIRKDKKIKFLAEKNEEVKNKRNVLFIASTGGHLNELMQVKPLFDKFNYHIITEKTKVDESFKEEYGDKIRFLIYGTKKYPIRYIFKFIANCFISLYYFFRFQPEVVVTTGTHTAVPLCYIAKLFGSKIIFIETFANRTTGTVAGRLVYPIADTFVVQWEEMHKVYPKSVCWGWLY